MPNAPEIVTAAAAAILEPAFDQVDEDGKPIDTKYYVHSHVATASSNEPALIRYLEDIYTTGTTSVEISKAPKSSAYQSLETSADITQETRKIADEICSRMQKTNARAGIVFGFRLRLDDGGHAFGIIKADIEDNRRFFLKLGDTQWTLNEVNELLPSPRDKYAKYAISPQPLGSGVVGIRDTQAQRDSAAAYFLSALGATMPRTEDTKLVVAQSALRAGHEASEIRRELSNIREDVAPKHFIQSRLTKIDDDAIEQLEGTDERPMPAIRAHEPLVTEWHTSKPYFSLRADASVEVTVEGRTITATLPEEHDEVNEKFIKKR